ncbi:MAG: SirB2 family protein [Bacteroidia bacterium]
MYTGMLHTHTLVVVLFVLLYFIKTILLFSSEAKLAAFSKRTRIAEMVISTLFLLTGLYLAFNAPGIHVGSWFWIKLLAVFASIPVAVIAFKRKKKPLALLAMALLLYAYGVSETKSPRMNKADYFSKLGGEATVPVDQFDPMSDSYDILDHGQALYINNCAVCHGNDGALGAGGSKNLQLTLKDKQEMYTIIYEGKNGMPAFKGMLSSEEMMATVAYVKARLATTNPH